MTCALSSFGKHAFVMNFVPPLKRSTLVPAVFAFVVMAASPAYCEDSETLLRKSLSSWKRYANTAFEGRLLEHRDGTPVDEKTIRIEYGPAARTRVMPYVAGHWTENPGEPHLDDKSLFVVAEGLVDGMNFEFNREFISSPPARIRYSRMRLNASSVVKRPWAFTHQSFFAWIDGIDVFSHLGTAIGTLKNLDCRSGELINRFGIACRKIEVHLKRPDIPNFGEVIWDTILTTEPSVIVLENNNLRGSNKKFVDLFEEQLNHRKVLEAQVMEDLVVPTEVRFQGDDTSHHFVVAFDSIEKLAPTHVGLWNHDKQTGVEFSGRAELSTRARSERTAISRHESMIDFTDEDKDIIRQYVLANTQEMPSRTNWLRLSLWGINVAALSFISWFVYRRLRYG